MFCFLETALCNRGILLLVHMEWRRKRVKLFSVSEPADSELEAARLACPPTSTTHRYRHFAQDGLDSILWRVVRGVHFQLPAYSAHTLIPQQQPPLPESAPSLLVLLSLYPAELTAAILLAHLLTEQEDKVNHVLMYACRNCDFIEETRNPCVFKHDLLVVSK